MYNNILEIIGKTPLVKINNLVDKDSANIYVKVESFNPSGSIKDRAAYYMFKDKIDKGELKKGDTIIEATSGNTGIAFAMIGAVLGINVILVMPESMSVERRNLVKAYGGEIVLTKASLGMKGAKDKTNELIKEYGYKILDQFSNDQNVIAHEKTTAIEILEELDNVDLFIGGVGTGGTVTGIGKVLKEKTNAKVVAIEPESNKFLKGQPGPHKIQGLGPNFIPKIYDSKFIDEILDVSNEDAMSMARKIAKKEGILVGISSGANMVGALKYAKELGPGKNIVTILPDTGERYLSTELFN